MASAQNEVGTAVARTVAIEGGIRSSISAAWDSDSTSAGAAMAMLAKRTAARDLYCMATVEVYAWGIR